MQVHSSVHKLCQNNSLCLLIQGTNKFALSIPEPENDSINLIKYISKFIELVQQSHLLGSHKIIGISTNGTFPGLTSEKSINDLKKSLKREIYKAENMEASAEIKTVSPHVLLTNPVSLDDKNNPILIKSKKSGNRWEAFYEITLQSSKNDDMLCVAENGSEDDILLDYKKCLGQMKKKYEEKRGFAKIVVGGKVLAVVSVEGEDGFEDLEEFLDEEIFSVEKFEQKASKTGIEFQVADKKEFEESKRLLILALIGVLIAFIIISLKKE